MNRENDYEQFTILMNTIGEVAPGANPSPDKTEIYFLALQDMDFSLIKQRMINHLKYKKFFPTISEIRQEIDFEVLANEDYALIEDLCRNFLFPEFIQCGVRIIEDKLKEKNKVYLIPHFQRWGSEIIYGNNPTATRAQFIKAHISEKKIERIRQIELGDKNQLKETNKLIDKIG